MTIAQFEATAQPMLDSLKGLCLLAPADKLDWAPADSVMPLGKLLWHLASSLTPVVEMAVTQQFPPPEFIEEVMSGRFLQSCTPAEAAATIDEHKQRLTAVLATASADEWDNTIITMPWGATGSVGAMAVEGLIHAAGHRYQLFLYLKLLGQPLGTKELFGM